MTTSAHSIHDKTFRLAMQHPAFAKSILKRHLPERIQQHLQWDSLTLSILDTSHISQHRQSETHADILYKANTTQGEALFLIHCEHQKKPDPLISIRFMNYVSGLLLNYARQHNTKKLPLMISLFYYQGPPSPYPHSLDWADCFQWPEQAKGLLNQPILIDLQQMNDQELIKSSPVSAGIELAFKYIDEHDFNPHTLPVLRTLRHAPFAMRKIGLEYILKRANVDETHLLDTVLTCLPEDEEIMMQLYQQNQQRYIDQGMVQGIEKGRQEGLQKGRLEGRQEGLQKGRLEGRQEGQVDTARQIAMKLLAQGMDPISVSEVTGLSRNVIETLEKETAAS